MVSCSKELMTSLILLRNSIDYNSIVVLRINILGFYLFTRRYWGNHCYFLFLRLLICLSSAGNLAYFRYHWWINSYQITVWLMNNLNDYHRLVTVSVSYYIKSNFVLGERRLFNHIKFFDVINRIHWNKHDSRSYRHLRSKIWWLAVLQFALRIAFRCVLHRYRSLDIHRWKFKNI